MSHEQSEKSPKLQPICPDCGNAPVNHAFHKGAIYFEMLITPFMYVAGGVAELIQPITRRVFKKSGWPRIFKTLHKLGLGNIATEPDARSTSRAKAFWQEAKRRGITMWEFQLFGLGREFFVAEYKGKVLSFEGLPRVRSNKHGAESVASGELEDPASLEWIDNKPVMRKKFAAAGFPVARGGVAFSFRKAKKIFGEIKKSAEKEIGGNTGTHAEIEMSVIIKPHQGSRSRHTTTHITKEDDLYIAFKKAKQLSPFVIVEQELVGMVHRITLIGGKVVGILRREPPSVFADGIHTIAELIAEENKNPLRAGPIFHTLVVDEETHTELSRQGYTLESIPPKEIDGNANVVFLHQKSSRGIGGGATDLTDTAHPDNIALFELIASYLDDSIVGIDFIIEDMCKSWKETAKCGVIECNSLPFIDLHLYPLVGKPRDTAGALWDLVLPESANSAAK